ncbi:MAG: hypothetical protein R3234_10495, partial [Thermoanaerobaculia bacterium]|nr:hypothetical protein [Thermoanaerobaculia bacterium]
MRRSITLAALVSITILAAPGHGQPQECLVGPGKAASLLIPYFEVDLANPQATTTLFAIGEGVSTPTLARVVLWTDWGIPTLAFDVYLDPLDVQTVNLRDVFDGTIPSTGETADLSKFEFCDDPDLAPSHSNPALTSDELAQLRSDHT